MEVFKSTLSSTVALEIAAGETDASLRTSGWRDPRDAFDREGGNTRSTAPSFISVGKKFKNHHFFQPAEMADGGDGVPSAPLNTMAMELRVRALDFLLSN